MHPALLQVTRPSPVTSQASALFDAERCPPKLHSLGGIGETTDLRFSAGLANRRGWALGHQRVSGVRWDRERRSLCAHRTHGRVAAVARNVVDRG